MQKFIHPDKFQMAKEELKDKASSLSAYVNNAYFTLAHDIERAEYLLKLIGANSCDEDEIYSSDNPS